jgi:hypothetical protein
MLKVRGFSGNSHRDSYNFEHSLVLNHELVIRAAKNPDFHRQPKKKVTMSQPPLRGLQPTSGLETDDLSGVRLRRASNLARALTNRGTMAAASRRMGAGFWPALGDSEPMPGRFV